MSKETISAFWKEVEKNPELSERLRSISQGSRDETAAGFVRLAAERGFVVTMDDAAGLVGLGPGGALTDEQLDAAAGGFLSNEIMFVMTPSALSKGGADPGLKAPGTHWLKKKP